MPFEDLLTGTVLIRILQDLFAPHFTRVFEIVTLLGSDYFLVGVAALVYWCYDKPSGRLLTYILLLGAYLNFFLKVLIPSPRPPLELRLAERNETSFGFPSGHVQDSTTLWTSTWLKFRKKILAAIGVATISAVGVSRVYLGLHYPFQVLGGIVVGLLYVALVFVVLRRVPQRNGRIRTIPQFAFSAAALAPLLLAVLLFGVAGDAGRVAGYLIGFSVGAIGEDRYVHFQTSITNKHRLVRIVMAGMVGAGILGVVSMIIRGSDLPSVFVSSLIFGVTVALIIPVVFMQIERRLFRS